MYKHILVPVENSSYDEAILAHVTVLAKLMGARLTLVHVADGFAARNQQRLDESDEIREDRAYLEKRCAEFSANGLDVDAVLECGEPAEKIVAMAEEKECDL
ncbi:MAG: universal stress protein, partial [Candidatus Hydrogenedentota bacterium]